MKLSRTLLWLLLALLPATFSWADDLALIKITSQGEVETATRLLDHAYARSGDRYLVSLPSTLKDSLTRDRLSFEIVMTDVSTRTACVVMINSRGKLAGLDTSSLGDGLRLESGVYLQSRASAAAAAAKDRGEVFITPLADKHVYFHYEAPSIARLLPNDGSFPTDTVINRISKDTIIAINQRLEAFRTRYITADSITAARNWIISKFASWGYSQITTPSFDYYGWPCYNIKVVKLGYAEPDQIIVIGGHYDTYNTQSDPTVFAPGADDDGSGTTLTMELARILANIPLRKTIVFIPFSAEEVGLVGSAAAAADFRATGAKVEAMLNYDMIGYTTDSYWDFSLSSGPNNAYAQLCSRTINRLTSLIPVITSMGTSSDHYSFYEQGFDIVDNIETDFNTPGWHTNIDLTSRMNFDYMTEVVKMAAASAAQIANSGSPAAVSKIVDVGDGSSLDVTIGNCGTGYEYWLYWGTTSANYTDSIQIPSGQCTYRVGGLTTGVTYYFGAYGKPSDGYRSIWSNQQSEKPLLIPRAPQNVVADPAEMKILLSWNANTEADMAFYRVYRHPEGSTTFTLLADNLLVTSYVDSVVTSGVKYSYKIAAVDLAAHESPLSAEVATYPATFNGGLLVVDELTRDYEYLVSEPHQVAYFDTVLGFAPHGLTRVDSTGKKLDKGIAGKYSSIIWDDDDFFNKQIAANSSTLSWYLSHNVNMFVCGIKTVQNWSHTPVDVSSVLYSEFMVSAWYADNFAIFVGGNGVNGWPSVEWGGASRGIRYGADIPVLTVRPGGTAIMTYDEMENDPNFEGKPCAVAYSGPHGKRVILAFPLYYLSPASATALMTKVKEFFGETATGVPPGDINHSGLTDLADLSTLVAYLTGLLPTLADRNAADVNHSCLVDLADLSAMVAYLTTGLPALQAGCVTP